MTSTTTTAKRGSSWTTESRTWVPAYGDVILGGDDKLFLVEADIQAYVVETSILAAKNKAGLLPPDKALAAKFRTTLQEIERRNGLAISAGLFVRKDARLHHIWCTDFKLPNKYPLRGNGPWWRYHTSALENKKLMEQPPERRMCFYKAISSAASFNAVLKDYSGKLPTFSKLLWQWRCSTLEEVEAILEDLVMARLVDYDKATGTFSIHDFYEWQYAEETLRVREHRAKKKGSGGDGNGTCNDTCNETRHDTCNGPVREAVSAFYGDRSVNGTEIGSNKERSDNVATYGNGRPGEEPSVGGASETRGPETAVDEGCASGGDELSNEIGSHPGWPGPEPSPVGLVVATSLQRLPSDPHASRLTEVSHDARDLAGGDGGGDGPPNHPSSHSWLDLTSTESLGGEASQLVQRLPVGSPARPHDAAAQNGQLPGGQGSGDASADAPITRCMPADVHGSLTRVAASQAGQRLSIERSANRSDLRRGSHDGINRSNPIQNSQTPVSESLSAFFPRRGKGAQ